MLFWDVYRCREFVFFFALSYSCRLLSLKNFRKILFVEAHKKKQFLWRHVVRQVPSVQISDCAQNENADKWKSQLKSQWMRQKIRCAGNWHAYKHERLNKTQNISIIKSTQSVFKFKFRLRTTEYYNLSAKTVGNAWTQPFIVAKELWTCLNVW